MEIVARSIKVLILATCIVTAPTLRIAHAEPAARVPGACSHQTTLPDLAYIAHVIGVTPGVLSRHLVAGQTVLRIARHRFHSPKALVTALLAPLAGKLPPGSSEYRHMQRAWMRLVVVHHPPLATAANSGKGKGASGC
jgi:hypothetical protein